MLVDGDPAPASSRRRPPRGRAPRRSARGPTRAEACCARTSYGSAPSRGAIVATTSSPSWRTPLDEDRFVASSIPSASSAAASVAEDSASASGAIRSAASTIVTCAPKRENVWPNSSPTAPPPTTSSERGTSFSSSAETWSIQSISSIPSTGGTAVREPVAIRIRSASSSRSPTRTRVRVRRTSPRPATAVKPGARGRATHCSCELLQRLLPPRDAREVDPCRAGLDPEHRRARVDVVRELRRDEVGLRRRAGDVRAAAAPALALDQGDARAVVAHAMFGGVACGGAAAEHEQVESVDHEAHCVA